MAVRSSCMHPCARDDTQLIDSFDDDAEDLEVETGGVEVAP